MVTAHFHQEQFMRIRPMAVALTLAATIVTPLAAVSPAQAAPVPNLIGITRAAASSASASALDAGGRVINQAGLAVFKVKVNQIFSSDSARFEFNYKKPEGWLEYNDNVSFMCWVPGKPIKGPYGTTNAYGALGALKYNGPGAGNEWLVVTDAWVYTAGDIKKQVPRCDERLS
ncbi:hypothetical protein ACQP25_09535 [Microtetraspora malaysiensis]|uniref:hypothetical protein n=1 Tax=Microtetraspora malaysiensis TaxID=161358 RepID=UPI003D91E42F